MALSYQVFLGEASEGNVPPSATTPAAGSSDTPAPSASAALRQALANLHASEREMETARIRVEQTEAALEDAIVASDRFAKAANLAQASAWGQGIYAAAGLLDGGVAQGSSE
ncbi:hypothetical protein OC846_001355 [Tilletia horrida]|uniref:Uncharacterized protein n=1 Tax=Tilletia horrida TaxID=155126 RepID=A0AAN6GTE7_9BASI|nr:hypothetical protein OC845_003548 [Tilletia horrida]KAK0556136.1 hypothetical protein OC846_001355 [Tilletia horrida]KAK0569062.1 hypothetical protein OC861_001304 [Tilletia horrida]